MADDPGQRKPTNPPPTTAGTVVMQAVVRPADRPPSDAPISSTVNVPVVPDMRENRGSYTPPAHGTTQVSAMMLMMCPVCAVPTPIAKFCTDCGALMEKRHCIECGNAAKPGAKFCERCGTKLP